MIIRIVVGVFGQIIATSHSLGPPSLNTLPISIFCETEYMFFYPLDFLLCQKERGKIQRFSKPTKFRINYISLG